MSSRSEPRPGYALALVFASRAMADVVTYFVLHPDAAPHFRALQRVTAVSSRSLQHELVRLRELGMIERERDGRLVRFRAVAGHPRWAAFRSVLREFGEPVQLLRIALGSVPGVEAAFIYGSCARGDMHPDSDIDVLAVGDALKDYDTRLTLAGASLEASMLLGHEVNVTRYTRDKLDSRREDGFLSGVLAGPKQWLVGDEAVLDLVKEEAA
jgi:predicted nucleotidyltransferase